MTQNWFITGVSSGLGFEVALTAIESGFTVIGTVRSRERAAEAVKKIEGKGGKCLELDVTNPKACFDVFQQAEKLHGKIDVLVNNAGLSWLGAIEDFTDEEAKQQMEVVFYGPLRLIQASLPGFRKRKTGSIVNITSIAGLDGLPSCGLYAASKFAVEGLSEALARELEQYNIQVLIVEPGALKTNFWSAYQEPKKSNVENYSAVKDTLHHFNDFGGGGPPGDASKCASRIVEAVSGTGMAGHLKGKVMRLPLGSDCVGRLEAKIQSLSQDLEATREAAVSADRG